MSRKLPFEEAFNRKMNELPTPNEDKHWQQMKQLLDEKEKRRAFFFFRNYKVLGGAAIMLLLLFSWLLFSPGKETNDHNLQSKIVQKQSTSKSKEPDHEATVSQQKKSGTFISKDTINSSSEAPNRDNKTRFKNNTKSNQIKQNSVANTQDFNRENKKHHNKNSTLKTSENGLLQTNERRKNNHNIKQPVTTSAWQDSVDKYKADSINDHSSQIQAGIEKNDVLGKDKTTQKDTANSNQIVVAKDSLQHKKRDSTQTAAQIKVSVAKHKLYFVDAGIQVKQQVPLGNQKISSYNYNGDKNLFTDYIPSVYIKFEKNKRWFLQGEFSYASPRLVKPFSYSQASKVNYVQSTVTTTATYLQKTFYSEIPLSFNLYIQPDWSVGAGAMYSWFHGAVTNQQTITKNAQSGLQADISQMESIKGFTDSFLYKSQTSLLLQVGYTKEKWSFQLRYIKDLQPFISYTFPDGRINDKRNASLEFLIGYRLFRSSKFNLKKH